LFVPFAVERGAAEAFFVDFLVAMGASNRRFVALATYRNLITGAIGPIAPAIGSIVDGSRFLPVISRSKCDPYA
jgi:hypothetical protein